MADQKDKDKLLGGDKMKKKDDKHVEIDLTETLDIDELKAERDRLVEQRDRTLTEKQATADTLNAKIAELNDLIAQAAALGVE